MCKREQAGSEGQIAVTGGEGTGERTFRACLFSLKCHKCKKGFIKHQSQWSCTSRNSHGASEMRPAH